MKVVVKLNEEMRMHDVDEYEIDTSRRFEGYQPGDLIIHGNPFDCTGKFPADLELAIRTDGSIAFRGLELGRNAYYYFHTHEKETFKATPEQCKTVAGLWSNRLNFEGLHIGIGASVQAVCPIDIAEEEREKGQKIYLA